ncbi:hypothetical protein CI610_01626 [invertebrate metagenome]|uniref:DUF2232 domain-containing protein n=1 Tax=invertebrate metagenome TaxID=1711999 RepID=A0A2H9T867_9ZZZZ
MMRGLAELAMRGPKQAIILAMVFAGIPMLFWLSAAIVSLVILRRGISHGLNVLMWALLPGIAWAAMGQFSIISGLAVTACLAVVLRQTVSWCRTLMTIVPLGALIVLALTYWNPPQLVVMTEMVQSLLKPMLEQSGALSVKSTDIQVLIHSGVIGILAWFSLAFCLLGLLLARAWQAMLFNPGGFGYEFRRIRLPVAAMMVLLVFMLASLTLPSTILSLFPVVTLPLFIAGLGLVHGLVELRNRGKIWLVIFYMVLALFTQLAYPVIVLTACLDSLFDFRKRISNRMNQDSSGV